MGSYMEIAVQAKRLGILSVRACYRSVKGHPFLVGVVLFSIFLYRSFPFLFAVLLSASPVLVCTAVLLGTLLSFGQPNIPEIEKEDEKLSEEVVSLRAGVSGNDTFVVERERDESFVVERYVGNRGDLVDKSVEDTRFVDDRVISQFENDVELPDCVPLIDENSREIHAGKAVVDEVARGFLEFEFEKKREIVEETRVEEGVLSDERVSENKYSLIRNMDDDEILAVEVGKFDGVAVRAYEEDYSESAPLTGRGDSNINDDEEEEEEEEDDDDDGSLYSDSDRAESSSPDASMADIIPMLDELHPLLDLDAPQPAHLSHDESDAGSEHSHRSDSGSDESDAGSKHSHRSDSGSDESDAKADDHGDEAEEDGADENEDDEEEAHGGKEDEKSAIKWTEDDQKNLMDLGTLELERNQRLENLIARRRARKSFRLTTEKNLIDLDSTDLPFNVPPVSTTRQNPFDLSYDSYEQMGLPPIPGSAPSILLPRRNPFDLPYDPNEEKPDLKGDNFEQEFLPVQQRETLFRRHESFSLGPSGLGGSRHDSKWRPVFVPERLSEGTSYSPFQRQSSELSESKLSSVPDTDSVSSVADTEEKKLGEQEFSKEAELLSDLYQAEDLIERGSQSSEDDDSEKMVEAEKRAFHLEEDEIRLGEVENHEEMKFGLSETRLADAHIELNTRAIHLEAEPVEEEGDSSSRSSRSSLSEVDDEIADEKNEGGLTSLVAGDDLIDESSVADQPSVEEESQFTSAMVDDNQNKEPVYDSSPHAAERLLSLSSISSGTHVDMSEVIKSPTSVDHETEVLGTSIEEDSYSRVVAGDVVHIVSREMTESRDIDVSKVSSSEVGHENNYQSEFVVPESEPVHVSVFSGSLSSEIQVNQEFEVDGASLEKDTYSKDEVQAMSQEITESGEIDVSKNASSEVGQENNDKSGFVVPESELVYVSVDSGSLSSEVQLAEDNMGKEEKNNPIEHDDVGSLVDIPTSVDEPEDDKSHMVVLSDQNSCEDITTSSQPEEQVTTVVEHTSVFSNLSTSGTEPLENWELVQDETTHLDQHQDQSDSSSDVISVEEEMYKDGLIHPETDDNAHMSSFDSEIQVESSRELGTQLETVESTHDHKSSDDSTLSMSEEIQPPSLIRQVSAENEHDDVTPLNEEEAAQSDHDQLQPLSSDAKTGGSTLQDSPVKADSSSEEKSPLEIEKDLSLSDKVVVEPCDDDHVELHEPTATVEEVTGDVCDLVDKALPDTSMDTSDSASLPVQGLDYEPLGHEMDMKNSILDRVVDDSNTCLPEPFDHELEADVAEEKVKEEVMDEIKDFDEDLLLELDTVGDFRINEVSEFPHTDLTLEEPTIGNVEHETLPSALNPELPVLEVRSFEDIDLAFRQLHEGTEVEEVIVPSMVKEQQLIIEGLERPQEITSDLQVVDAESLEDIRSALKQVSDGNLCELPKSADSTNELAEVEVSKVDSSTLIESANIESGVKEVTPIADEAKHESLLEDSSTSTSKN